MPDKPNRLGSIARIASTASESRFQRFHAQKLSAELLPKERVHGCLRHVIPGKDTVQVVIKHGQSAPSYRNLMTCGSVWVCPVCAAKITEERRRELSGVMETTKLNPVLLTYTFSHNAGMDLSAILSAMLEAFRVFKSGRWFQGLQYKFGWVGSVRALEVTHGANGWHPHMHELVFLERGLDAIAEGELWHMLSARWLDVLKGQGLTAERDIGLDLTKGGQAIGEYIQKASKWGLEHEVTKAPVKRGRKGGRTPFALLVDYGNGDDQAGKLFVEYAYAFKGRNQLVWSRNLRERLGLGKEKTDAELLQDKTDILDVILARLTRQEFDAVYWSDNRGALLDAAASGDIKQVEDFLIRIGVWGAKK